MVHIPKQFNLFAILCHLQIIERSRKKSQRCTLSPRFSGFSSNELAVCSRLFWNWNAFSCRSHSLRFEQWADNVLYCFGTEMLSLAGATLAKTGFYFARSDFRCYVGKERVIEQPTFHNVSKNSQNNNKRSPTTTSKFILWGQLKFIWFITATRLRFTALEIFFSGQHKAFASLTKCSQHYLRIFMNCPAVFEFLECMIWDIP